MKYFNTSKYQDTYLKFIIISIGICCSFSHFILCFVKLPTMCRHLAQGEKKILYHGKQSRNKIQTLKKNQQFIEVQADPD